MNGKGSKPRPFTKYEEYLERWDEINWGRNNKKDKDKKDYERKRESTSGESTDRFCG